jgi:hypothetical protein
VNEAAVNRLVKDLAMMGHNDDAEACYKGSCVCERQIKARVRAFIEIHYGVAQ